MAICLFITNKNLSYNDIKHIKCVEVTKKIIIYSGKIYTFIL